MKKLNLKKIGEKLSKDQMKNVSGGFWCMGECYEWRGCSVGCRCQVAPYGPGRGNCVDAY